MQRRSFILGAALSFITPPAIVRAASLDMVRGLRYSDLGHFADMDCLPPGTYMMVPTDFVLIEKRGRKYIDAVFKWTDIYGQSESICKTFFPLHKDNQND